MRAFLTFIAVVLVLLVGAVLLLPMFVSADLVKREVESAVQEATGRELTIAGDVSITAWPALGATIGEVTFANAPGATEPQMATMQELRAELAIMPLLSGEIRVDQFVLLEPVIHLEVARDGTPNWQFEGAPAPAEAPAGEDVPGDGQTPGGMAPTEVVLADIRVENGRVTYRNAQTGDAYEFSDVDMSVSLPGLDEQMTLDGALTWNAERVNVDVAVDQPRAVIEGGTTPATIKVASNPLNVDYAGSITMGEGLSTDGTVSLDVPSVRNLAAWTGNPMPEGGGFGPLSLSGDVSSRPDRYAFSNAQISFDGTSGTGNMTVLTSGARPKITGALSVDQIDTNVYSGQGDTGWSTDTIDLSGLKAVDADLDLSADEIIFGNIVIGQSALDLGIDNGLMTAVLNKLALYGGRRLGQADPQRAQRDAGAGRRLQPFGPRDRTVPQGGNGFRHAARHRPVQHRRHDHGQLAGADGAEPEWQWRDRLPQWRHQGDQSCQHHPHGADQPDFGLEQRFVAGHGFQRADGQLHDHQRCPVERQPEHAWAAPAPHRRGFDQHSPAHHQLPAQAEAGGVA